ncbi:hypothetical protein WI71_17425 [Burkholderia diffusa]|nr:hypothetical protein WI71_17425 [Burkholderia diffusa]
MRNACPTAAGASPTCCAVFVPICCLSRRHAFPTLSPVARHPSQRSLPSCTRRCAVALLAYHVRYRYTDFDRALVHSRAAQFRDQLERWQHGTLNEDAFRPLRLQNGWYVQRHAPMLRVAVPYGELSSAQQAEHA